MGKFIQLTTKKISNLPLGWDDERVFKICLNTDHIVLARPTASGNGCMLFIDSQCTTWIPEVIAQNLYSPNYEDDLRDVRSIRASEIIVAESYEQVLAMLC